MPATAGERAAVILLSLGFFGTSIYLLVSGTEALRSADDTKHGVGRMSVGFGSVLLVLAVVIWILYMLLFA